MKGLTVDVFRAGRGDCTNGGISSTHDRLTLIGPGIPEIFEPTDDAPAVLLDMRQGFDHPCLQPRVVPAGPTQGAGPMFGGNFVWTSDSRFRKVSERPLPIHDRFE